MPRQLDLDALTHSFSAIARHKNWSALHNPKNLACAISVEAAELLQLFQWQDAAQVHAGAEEPARELVAAELADLTLYINALADRLGIDLLQAVQQKCAANEHRFGLRDGD